MLEVHFSESELQKLKKYETGRILEQKDEYLIKQCHVFGMGLIHQGMTEQNGEFVSTAKLTDAGKYHVNYAIRINKIHKSPILNFLHECLMYVGPPYTIHI